MASASVQPENSQLAELRWQLIACSDVAEKLFGSVTEKELIVRGWKGSWSIGQCIQHLTATTGLYLPIMNSSLADAPPGSGPFKMDFRGKMLKWILEPPYHMKVNTLPGLNPGVIDPTRVLPDFLASQQQLLEAMLAWDGRAIDKVFVTSPFNQRLRYNMYSLFNVVAAHQRRHLWQAQAIKHYIQRY